MAGSPPQGYPQQPGPYQPPPPGPYPPQPGAPYGVDPMTGLPFSDKQKLVAGLLQVLLPGFAIGRFYTGHTGLAIAQIAVTWLTCGVGALWPLIDGIMILIGGQTDANGLPLREN
jgi:TM2 domain-containing membrane protein YozV